MGHGTSGVSRAPRLELDAITPNNIGQLRCLNRVLFPVDYLDSFYEEFARDNSLGRFGKSCVIWS
jgi:hypothetical protein